jgi:deazaflavin-dependent oxidoreductase (nitroreductase family)
MQAFNQKVVDEFRANGGKVRLFQSADLLLLTTAGAKSGQPRLVPLAFFTIDGKMLIIGTYGGADVHPGWVHNLRASPRAHVEVGTTDYDVIARELQAEERDDMLPKLLAEVPGFDGYQSITSRVIPIFELQKV